jgi:endonuclease/exonuclease/phosphatase (EEP) superfamily protein YafD
MIRRVVSAAVLLGVAAALLVIAWPSLFGLSAAPVVAQLVSLRALSAALAIIGALALALVAMLWRGARRFLASLALLAMLFAAINVAVLSTRGFGDESFPTRAPAELSVLSWNTLGDAPGTDRITQLALDEQADIIVLPETSQETGVEVAEGLRAAGRPMWVYSFAFDYIAKARSTTVLVSAAIGEYVVDDGVGNTTVLPSMVLRPDGHDGPTIIGVHPVAPLPSQLANWRADLDWINGICRGEQTILAGDLNATADHFRTIPGDSGGALRLGLGDCLDAGLLTGNGAVGTWPTRLPAILGAPIDHIMVTDDITVTGFRVITTEDGTGSDHRPIVARVIL